MKKNLKLNNGASMSPLGLGTWNAPNNIVGEAVSFAINEAGYRHIDCASAYGNEAEIGEALGKVNKAGKVKREELFITSKLWNADHDPKNVVKACKKSLKDLQLDYLDLYLVHWGLAFQHGKNLGPIDQDGRIATEKVPISETWKAMEELVSSGLVKSIGVANFTTPMLVDLLSYANVKPVINQIELHPYNTQSSLVDFCQANDIELTAYSPLGSPGIMSEDEPRLLSDSVISEVASNHKKTPGQVLIRWSLQRGVSLIPKSTNKKRIVENISVFDFELSKEEVEKINELNRNHRYVNPINFWNIPYFD